MANVRDRLFEEFQSNPIFTVSEPAFPRIKTIEILLHMIGKQPKLTKEASSTLIDLGEAIHATAIRQEIDVLIRGTLRQEVYVRNSCLQAIQVHMIVRLCSIYSYASHSLSI